MNNTNVFVIADLHLSFSCDKPMNIFGDIWEEHEKKIELNWKRTVTDGDYVVIPGDISWAMTADEAVLDLAFINDLPGTKILLKGNHEFWWTSMNKLNILKKDRGLDRLIFLINDAYMIEGAKIAVCGSRGWKCPGDKDFTSADLKIYKREAVRFDASLKTAAALAEKNGARIISFTHFPPFNYMEEPSDFTILNERYGVKNAFYGHLHGSFAWSGGIRRGFELNGVKYDLASSDFLSFEPLKIN